MSEPTDASNPPTSGSGSTAKRRASQAATSGAVLIVDDDADDLGLSRRSIEGLHLPSALRSVNSGKEMIDYLNGVGDFADRKAFPYPAVVLLDLKMPEMDGFEVLTWLRSHPEHSKVRVIVLSGIREWRQIERAYQLGARSFLSKPVNASEFMNTVRTLDLLH
jgi:CheY-like chemotaxis protein